MPETALIGELLAGAQAARGGDDRAERSEAEPERRCQPRGVWEALRDEAAQCTRCDLYKCATQTVFGEGRSTRDHVRRRAAGRPGGLAGRPFVGPAGQLFDAALEEAGIDRATTYVTNAVKHFKFVGAARGASIPSPTRARSRPAAGGSTRSALIRPPLTVALGATAARSLIGKAVTIAKCATRR